MPEQTQDEVLSAWIQLPAAIAQAIEGLTEDNLDLRGGPNGWSIRETVHHLVEANVVAAAIVIAGMAKSGCVFDWSWLMPDPAWMQRMGYNTAPAGPAVDVLRTMCPYAASLVRTAAGAEREVRLLDAPGAEPRLTTVAAVLRDEVEHGQEHLREIREIRTQSGV